MKKNSENTNAFLIHISAFAGYLFPFGSIITPLILWQTLKERSGYLDEHGKDWSTKQLSNKLTSWQGNYQSINLVIGGADGLSETIIEKAENVWSLSKLTLPHAVVRVIIIEQLYRAWSLLNNHPYHRK